MAFVAVNPATGRKITGYREHSPAQIEDALARAVSAQRGWRAMALRERTPCLRALAGLLRRETDALATIATNEMGKPITQARGEVEKCADACDYFARHAAAGLAPENPRGSNGGARVTFEPLGVILGIMPWNFPYWQVIRAVVPAIASGNAVLVKPAPNVPGCAFALDELFVRAGFPRGVYQTLLAPVAHVPKIIADARVHGVTLTGSTSAGKKVATLAGAAMKPGVFELGGSDPAIVLNDADIAHAAETCANSRLLNSGQSCICAKRFIVLRAARRKFEERLVHHFAARRVGDPLEPKTDIGPLARLDLREQLVSQIRRSVRQGARVLHPGGAMDGPGFFYAPVILTDVSPGMTAHDEEIFGPVAAIVPVRDEAEAVRVANASRFGLGASIYTRNPARAKRIAASLETGNVFINDFVRSSPDLPFGGIKESGYGRELGRWGLHAFVNVKATVHGP